MFGTSFVMFAGSGVGLILLAIGQTMVVVCACSDMVRALSVPRSHRRYVASTVFRTLAIPSIIATGMSVLIDALSWSWTDVGMSMFVLTAIIFRLHHDKDEDNWWKGKGRKLARWARRQFSAGTRVSPAMG
jgi:Mn2+/Fe2+ NRAMP family transporter